MARRPRRRTRAAARGRRPTVKARKSRARQPMCRSSGRRQVRVKTRKPTRRRAVVNRRKPPKVRRQKPEQVKKPAASVATPSVAVPRKTRPKIPPSLQRERRALIEEPEAPTETPTIAETAHSADRLADQLGAGQALTGGDLDADWASAYSSGDEASGGDNPTPDQDRVDDIGRALGVRYADEEELRGSDKIVERDRHRWEWDPASAEDFGERTEVSEDEEEKGQ